MFLFFQNIILGLVNGTLYGLMGFGIAFIFRAVGTINFAQGHSAMIGVFFSFTLMQLSGNLALAIIGGIALGFLIGIFMDRVLMRRIKHLSHGAMIMITLGVLLVFDGLSLVIWGTEYRFFPTIVEAPPLQLTGANGTRLVIPLNDIVITFIALGASLALALFLRATKIGAAIRARAEDELGARSVGINIDFIDSLVWAIGIALGVLVGVLIAPKTQIHANMLTNIQLFGITAGVLGGFTNLYGAIVGGLILGVIERFVGSYVSPDFRMSIILLIIILVLAFRPQGLLGTAFKGRV